MSDSLLPLFSTSKIRLDDTYVANVNVYYKYKMHGRTTKYCRDKGFRSFLSRIHQARVARLWHKLMPETTSLNDVSDISSWIADEQSAPAVPGI
jgi:hypothetical protein